jgi:cytochrome c oxidase assembly factor 1
MYSSAEGTVKRKPVTVDVELPDVMKEKRTVRNSSIAFAITMVICFLGIIKYEDANAPVVSSTLYTLRRSDRAREVLGGNIQISSLMPWISGRLHSARGIMDFSYTAVGDKSKATIRFNATLDKRLRRYVVHEWSLTTPDGIITSLMDDDFHPFVPGGKEEATSRPAQY